MRFLLAISLLIFSTACDDKTTSNNSTQPTTKQNKSYIVHETFDTTLIPFKDNAYKLTLHLFNTNSKKENINNSTVTFSRNFDDTVKIFFTDSMYCAYPKVENRDFNGDAIDDILFFYSTGARANPTYHLYLVDTLHHVLNRIKGFEDLPNPSMDSTNNIISTMGLAGTIVYCNFFRITKRNKLISLGHSFEAELDDSIKYAQAVKQILKENRR